VPPAVIGFMGLITTSFSHEGHKYISHPVQAKQLLQERGTSKFEKENPHD